jgi:WD40 repeat protein
MFSPDGKILAAKSPDRIVFWDPMNRRLLGPLEEPGATYDALKEMAFSPDGHLLAVSAVAGLHERGFIRLWDVAQRRVLQVDIPSPRDQALPLAFSKNGDRLMSVDRLCRIIFHDMRLQSWQDLACQRANRNLTRAEWQQYLPGEPYQLVCPDLPVPEE